MRRGLLRTKLLSGAVLVSVLVVSGPAGARADAGCRPLRAIFYAASGSLALAQALAADASPCAQYYVSVPPLAADKTQMRSGTAAQIRALGPDFHALAEVNYTAWQGWVASTGNSWYQAGVVARTRMAAAGFDVSVGDSWAVNELTSAVRLGSGAARQNVRDFVRGLYDGNGGAATKGVAFVEGIAQPTVSLAVYKSRLESWLQDAGFWADMSSYVGDFLQENYGDVRDYGVAGADVTTRLGYLNAYLEHVLQLTSGAPATASASSAYLQGSYAALASAAWAWSSGFGYTAVPFDQMQDFVSAEVDAMRSYDASLGWSADRIGFAWDPSNSLGLSSSNFSTQSAAIAARLAAAIAASADPAAPGGGACASPWCTATVNGAAFTPAWGTFSTWTPTSTVFGSTPQTVVAGTASGPISVQLAVGGIVTALPVDTMVQLSSSSPGGAFSTSPTGPWSPTVALMVPAGSTSATFYMLDTQPGTPTVTASVGAVGSSQTEIVTAPASPLALGGGSNTVTYVAGGAPVGVDPALTVSDAQSPTLVSASVAVSSGLDPGDVLAATTAGTGISASYVNGTLSLTGTASLALYQAVLQGITFSGATSSGGSRTVVWTASDGITTASAVSTILYTAAPGTPQGIAASPGDGQATITFEAPASDGGAPITTYTVTSSPGGIQATGGGSPIVVSGLTNGTTYTFTVTAANAAGTGPVSAPSNPVTPTGAGGVIGSGGSGGSGGGGGGGPPNLNVSFNGQPPARVGSDLSLYVLVGNKGDVAFRTTLTVTTSGLRNVGVATLWGLGQGCTASAGTVTCDLLSLPPSTSGVQVALLGATVSGPAVTATATFSGTGLADLDPSDDRATFSWSAPPAPATPSTPLSPSRQQRSSSSGSKTQRLPLTVVIEPGRRAGSVRVGGPRKLTARGYRYPAGRYAYGSNLELTASPNPGWRFSQWHGSCNGHKPTCTLTMNHAHTIIADFAHVKG